MADASIYSLIRPPVAAVDPVQQYGRVMQLKGLMGQQELQGLQLDQARRAMEDERATAEAYREAGGDPAKVRDILYGRGLYKPAIAAETALLERESKRATIDKTKADTGKSQAETLLKHTTYMRDRLAQVQDQAGYNAWLEEGARLFGPDVARTSPQQFTPEVKNALLMKADDLIVPLSKQLEIATTQRGQDMLDRRTREEGAANRGVTIREQNLREARERERLRFDTDPARIRDKKTPPGYRFKDDGSLEAIPGGPADIKSGEKAESVRSTVDSYKAARDGLISGLSDTITGPLVGRAPAFTAKQQIAEGGVAAIAPVLKQLFRVAGEGVFTDRDQELLLMMVPKRTDEPEAIKSKMDNIDKIVEAKLGVSLSRNVPSAPGEPNPQVEQTRIINGKLYIKRGKQWFEQ